MRWQEKWFDFHGECDLVLLQAPEFQNGLALTIHVRTTIRYTYSYVSSAALKIGNDTLQVNSWGDYSLNGVHSASTPNTLSSFEITRRQENEKKHSFQVDLGGDMDDLLVISTFKDIVAVEIDRAHRDDFGSSVGLMGHYRTGKMLARDGVAVIDDPNLFGQEWQVRNTEPMLFESIRAPQYPEKCILPSDDVSTIHRRRLGDKTVSRAQADNACSHIADSPDDKQRCIDDVIATNDLEMAEAF